MLILNKMFDNGINKVYSTLTTGVAATFILVLGSKSISTNYDYNIPSQIISYDNNTTNIYKSFSNNYCITLNVPVYYNNKSVNLGVKNVLISEEKLENLKKLELISLLEDNWNNNGAKAFCTNLIMKVRNIIMFLDIQPEIFPTACNSLQLEYDKADGSHMEIELIEEEEAEVFLINKNGCENMLKIPANIESINKVVNDFYGQHI